MTQPTTSKHWRK